MLASALLIPSIYLVQPAAAEIDLTPDNNKDSCQYICLLNSLYLHFCVSNNNSVNYSKTDFYKN